MEHPCIIIGLGCAMLLFGLSHVFFTNTTDRTQLARQCPISRGRPVKPPHCLASNKASDKASDDILKVLKYLVQPFRGLNRMSGDSKSLGSRNDSGMAVNEALSNFVTRHQRDPRRVLVVGARGKLGRDIISALKLSRRKYSIVAVVRSLDDVPSGCARVIVRDVVTEAHDLARDVVNLGCGKVIWCASARGCEKPQNVDYAAVRNLVRALGSEQQSSIRHSNTSGSPGDESPGTNGWLANQSDFVQLFDFASVDDCARWYPLDDVIMGGRSKSSMHAAAVDSGFPAVWSGNVTKAGGGGFASVRGELAQDNASPPDVSSCVGIAITCRGDGRPYKLNLKCEDVPEHVFQARFMTSSDGSWQTIRIPFDEFVPVRRGVVEYAENSADGSIYGSTLDLASIKSLGLVCSKLELGGLPCPLFREGPFRLELSRIDAYRASTPRFVLVSSAAVTRPFWNQAKKDLYPGSADIPIVNLNEKIGNLLGYKLAGENAVRLSSIPYTIVRPTGLQDNSLAGRKVNISKGDFAVGRISRADVARAIVTLLDEDDASWKTIEIDGDASKGWGEMEAEYCLASALQKLPLDSEQDLYSMELQALDV